MTGTVVAGLGAAAAAALFWLLYFRWKDRLRPEPARLVLAAFALGGVAALLALGGYALAERLGLPGSQGGGTGALLALAFLQIGPIEEGAKFAVARSVVYRWRHFDELFDGVVYAAAIGIGFACFESVLLARELPLVDALARALSSPLSHALFSSVSGLAMAWARLRVTNRLARFAVQCAGLLAAAAVHGLYDFLLLAWNATLPASLVILALWIPLLLRADRYLSKRRR